MIKIIILNTVLEYRTFKEAVMALDKAVKILFLVDEIEEANKCFLIDEIGEKYTFLRAREKAFDDGINLSNF